MGKNEIFLFGTIILNLYIDCDYGEWYWLFRIYSLWILFMVFFIWIDECDLYLIQSLSWWLLVFECGLFRRSPVGNDTFTHAGAICARRPHKITNIKYFYIYVTNCKLIFMTDLINYYTYVFFLILINIYFSLL